MVDLKAVETEAYDLEHEIETEVSTIGGYGWLGIGMLVLSNLVGVFLHI